MHSNTRKKKNLNTTNRNELSQQVTIYELSCIKLSNNHLKIDLIFMKGGK